MSSNLILHKVSENFSPESDVPLGPWCFQDIEHIYPDWDQLDFINPYANAKDMDEASFQAISLFEGRVADFAKDMNERHQVNFTEFSWRHMLIGWYAMLIQVSYTRFRHIEKFIQQHKGTAFRVKLAPQDLTWTLAISHNMSQLTSRADFDYWLSSQIIRVIAPKEWTLEEDVDFIQETASKSDPITPAEPTSFREKVRDQVLSWIDKGRFDRVYGTAWRSQLFFLVLLNILPGRKRKEQNHVPILDSFDPYSYFSNIYLGILADLAEVTMPQCYANSQDFHNRLKQASADGSYRAGKLRVISPDVFNEELKFKTVLAYEAGEKILATQHGSWYGTVSSTDFSHAAEYAHYAFLSWGWNKHIYKGNFVPLPSPLLNHYKSIRKSSCTEGNSGKLLFVENIVNLRSTRLSGQPMPADIVKRRHYKKEFLDTLENEIFDHTLYRPHIHHAAGIDETTFLKRHFKNLEILTEPSMDNALMHCKLYVSNHYGTTLHLALAANIPTVCYWDSDYPLISDIAKPHFQRLKDAKIIFDNHQDAAAHINSVWNDIDGWWQNPELQNIRKDWCDLYARTSPFWIFKWIKALATL